MSGVYNDYPIEKIAQAMAEHIELGHEVYQKWSCKKCGSRQTMAEKNKIFASGKCEECNSITDIRKTGCNYMVFGDITSIMQTLKR